MFIDLWFSDILGSVKNLTIPADQLEKAINEGIWFDGSSVEGFGRIFESDMYLKPDRNTFAILPWTGSEKTARLICDVFSPKHEPFPGDPRFILRRALERVQRMNYEYKVGTELEFYMFKRDGTAIAPLPHDQVGYFDLGGDHALNIRKQMCSKISQLGIRVEAGHHEVGTGQHEIDLKYTDALSIADNLITAKVIIKKVAEENGLFATFMPKPIFGKPGCGMHVHQSFFRKGQNAFSNPKDRYGLSQLAYNFLAGQLKHIKEISAIISPIVNSYKRLVSGFEAPVYICWGQMNRSALIRIPRISKGKTVSSRLELRSVDPSCNPYLAFAVMLAAGLNGVQKKLPVAEPVEENVYHFEKMRLKEKKIDLLPRSLFEALEYFGQSKLIKETLGEHLMNIYLEIKTHEWQEYCIQVSTWELEKYIELY